MAFALTFAAAAVLAIPTSSAFAAPHTNADGAMRRAARLVPFGDTQIPILAAEHLLVAKVVFNRAKDWLDIEQMLVLVPALQVDEVHRWLDHLLGPDDPRATRFRLLHDELHGGGLS